MPLTSRLSCALFVAALGPFQFGYHLAELNAPQAVITCEKKGIQSTKGARLPQCIPMNVDQFALVTSIFTLGGLIGALVAGPLCSTRGRVWSMAAMNLLFVAGPILQTLATGINILAAGRFVSGIGAGAATVVIPIYISEIAPPNAKGLFGALTQIMINLGILSAQLLGFFLSHDSLWRIIMATAGFIGLLQLIGLVAVPESPKWLAEQGAESQARKVLRRLRGDSLEVEPEVRGWRVDSVRQEISEEESLLDGRHISKSRSRGAHAHQRATSSFLSAILDSTSRPAILAVVAIMLAQQLTGINSIVMYSVHLLTSLLPTSAALLSVFVSLLNLFMTTVCAPLSDRIGRKTCLLLSLSGLGVSSLLLATGLSQGLKLLGAISTLTFVTSFAIGMGPVPFILANELVHPEAVAATQSWALASNWIATFVVSQFFPRVNKALGEHGRVYYIFAGAALLFGLFIAWWVPETKGKSSVEEVWQNQRNYKEHEDRNRARLE